MRSLKPFALMAVVGMVAFALLVPIADAAASSPSSTVKASENKSCKKAKRESPRRSPTRTSADTARRCKKVVLRRTYRGKTSQGERIVIKTNNLRKNVYDLYTYVKHECNTPFSGKITISDLFEMLFPVRLRGTAFSAPFPSFDAEFLYKGTVTGHAGASTASGQGNIPAGGQGDETCDATTFSFSIPKVREVRGIRPSR